MKAVIKILKFNFYFFLSVSAAIKCPLQSTSQCMRLQGSLTRAELSAPPSSPPVLRPQAETHKRRTGQHANRQTATQRLGQQGDEG